MILKENYLNLKGVFKMENNEPKRLKLTDFEQYAVNPVSVEGIVERSILSKGDVVRMVTSEGEEQFVQTLGSQQFVQHDPVPYVKVFTNALNLIKDFTSPEMKVWCFISSILVPKSDSIILNISDCKDFTGYTSDANIYKGIIGLLDKKVIFRKIGNSNYFINVNMFFNGKRI